MADDISTPSIAYWRLKMSSDSTVSSAEVDENFCREVLKRPGGKRFKECFQCGTCTASCPVRAVSPRYNPRVLVKMVELGLRSRVLTSESIWLCVYCHLCWERCPRDVKLPELITVLRNMAVEAGYIHPSMARICSVIMKHGRIYEVDDFLNAKRIQFGLPPIQINEDDWKRLSQLLRLSK
ncbi:MAG: 4Fe-4S dicluster domain-containing protein [Candidatus Bathyarchaeia archaeon]